MLPERLLSYRRTDDGALAPSWLSSRDEPWLRELAAEVHASDGRRMDLATTQIVDAVTPLARRHGANRRVVEAVWHVERKRWQTRIDSKVSPEKIRRVLFDLAAERSREEALASAARELQMTEGEIEASLFADRARARKLVAPPLECDAGELVAAYNLALAQSLLSRATEVTAVIRAHVRRVVGYAKLLRLMAKFEQQGDALRIAVSGPLALFHDTLKYGRALAAWFPAVVTTPGWSLEARVLARGEPARFALDASAPLPRTHAMSQPHHSALEARLERDLRRLGSPWRVVREATAVRVGTRLAFPDFSLVSASATVLVEVVGWFTPEYLAQKQALLESARVPLLLCIDRRYVRGELASDPRVVPFQRTIDANDVVRACERLARQPRSA